jgi:hypothetical protein
MDPAERQEIIDAEHLRILAICYYVSGGMGIFFSCFALIYVAMGLVLAIGGGLAKHPDRPGDAEAAAMIGVVIVVIGLLFLLIGWTIGGLTLYVGRSIQQRRRRTLTLVIAVLHCLWIPIGTLLGVFTFIVLMRPSVMRLYAAPMGSGVVGSRPLSGSTKDTPAEAGG